MKRWVAAAAACAVATIAGPGPSCAADSPIRIGILSDMSGPLQDESGPGGIVAAQLAIEDFGGTVIGLPVEVVGADTQNRADIGASIASKWYDVDGVDMITGLDNSAAGLAVHSMAEVKHKIDINTGGIAPDFTGSKCHATGFGWTVDAYALATVTTRAVMAQGDAGSWFYITLDQTAGRSLGDNSAAAVRALGGKVLGVVRNPLNTADFASNLLGAQSSHAKVVAFGNNALDFINSIKQAFEFGLPGGGQKLVGLVVTDGNITAIGLQAAQGLLFTSAFYWDLDDQTRAFSKRFAARNGDRPPTQLHASIYSAVNHYLKAVAGAGTRAPGEVAAKMMATPVVDMMTHGALIRADHRLLRDLYLMEVKSPAESHGPWDIARVLQTIPGSQAFRPLQETGCSMVKS